MAQAAANENAGPNPAGPAQPRAFSPTELKNMLGQCLKMASENKITPQNTWALPLIEHLPELIREEGGTQTNFQRASVTLDAGVKIYSYRVDSVHTETFKILGGLGRASNQTDDVEAGELGDGGLGDGEEGAKRKRRTHELNPEATLEPSLEALNVKKFDLAFAVDPLFHKTSAQFDEGGAKGLLLNNLSVFRGCEIVFDSMDVPENALDCMEQHDPHAMVDLAGVQQHLAALQLHTGSERISPTLDAILDLLGEAPADDAASAAEEFVRQVAEAGADVVPMQQLPWLRHSAGAAEQQPAQPPDDAFDAAVAAEDGSSNEQQEPEEQQQQDGETSLMGVVAEYAYAAVPAPADVEDYDDDGGNFGGDGGYDDYSDDDAQQSAMPQGEQAAQDGLQQAAAEADAGLQLQPLGHDAIQFLIEAGSNNMVTRAKGWAGASHWRYRAVPQPAAEGEEGGEEGAKPKKRTSRRKNDPLDFVALMDAQEQEAPTFELMPSKHQRGAKRARRSKAPAKTLLPEDHHYKVENLNRYALRPRNTLIAAAEAAVTAAGAAAAAGGNGEQPAFDDADGFDGFGEGGYDDDDDNDAGGYDGGWGDDSGYNDAAAAEGGELAMVQASRRVEKVEVNYSRAAKQVDVRSLKELMWRGIHSVPQPGGGPPSPDTVLQFQDVLATVPEHNPAGRLEDLSVHLCFICVLHLANEHGLVIKPVPELDQLLISNVPAQDR